MSREQTSREQIVRPKWMHPHHKPWNDKQVELAGQRWIADGDAPLPREFKKMSDLNDFLTSVRLREVFKSERKRVDKQRRVDAVIAAIVSERRRVSLAGPKAFLFQNARLELPQPVGLQFLTVQELLQFRVVDRSARRAGEQDHHWIERLSTASVTADAPGAAPVETDWGWRHWRNSNRMLDEARCIQNVERDRVDAEAEAMAQNDPAVLAWLRAELTKCPPRLKAGLSPEKVDYITLAITHFLLHATSARGVKHTAAKYLGQSFASATLARDLCVKRGLESGRGPVKKQYASWSRTRAMDRFFEAVLYRWSHAKKGAQGALSHGRYADNKSPWSRAFAAARRATYYDPRCLDVKRGWNEFIGEQFSAGCRGKNGCQCTSAHHGLDPAVCLGSSALSAGSHAWWISFSTRRSGWSEIDLRVGVATTAVDLLLPLGSDGAGFGVRVGARAFVDDPLWEIGEHERDRYYAGAFHNGRRRDAPPINGDLQRGEALLSLEIHEDGSATLAIADRRWTDQTPRVIAENLRLAGGPALRPAVSFCEGATVDIRPLMEVHGNARFMKAGPDPGVSWAQHVYYCQSSNRPDGGPCPCRMPHPGGRSG